MFIIQETPDKECRMDNGNIVKPIITLASELGAKAQIIYDDRCYRVLVGMKINGEDCYSATTYIFKEAFDALKTLPNPEDYYEIYRKTLGENQ